MFLFIYFVIFIFYRVHVLAHVGFNRWVGSLHLGIVIVPGFFHQGESVVERLGGVAEATASHISDERCAVVHRSFRVFRLFGRAPRTSGGHGVFVNLLRFFACSPALLWYLIQLFVFNSMYSIQLFVFDSTIYISLNYLYLIHLFVSNSIICT